MTEQNPAAPAAPNAAIDPDALAEHILARAKAEGVRAEVVVNKIPPHIAANILEFLRRVKSEGMEAIAWCEAYNFMQQYAPQQGNQPQLPGVPFGGLPQKK